MKLAVTDHVVDRFRERVRGADKMSTEAIRTTIRDAVVRAHKEGKIRPHPVDKEQRLAPYVTPGGTVINICIGKNTTNYPGDLAAVSVIYDRELGEVKMGVTLGDKFPQLKELVKAPPKVDAIKVDTVAGQTPRFILKAGTETFYAMTEQELINIITAYQLVPSKVVLYRLQEKFSIRTVLELEE